MIKALSKTFIFNVADAIMKNPYLAAVRHGLTLTLPVILAGTLGILLNTFPSSAYQEFMLSFFGENWQNFGEYINNGTFGVMSIIMGVSIAHSLAVDYNAQNLIDRVNPSILSLVVLSCMFCMMEPLDGGLLETRWIGVHGLLLTISISLVASFLFRSLLYSRFIRLRFYAGTAGASMSQAMRGMFPAIITILVFAGIKEIFKAYGIDNPSASFYELLYYPFALMGSNNLITAELFGFFRQILWFFGIHGSLAFEPVVAELYIPALQENIANVRNGLPPTIIFTETFFDSFISIGGSGTTIGLVIACLLGHKDTGAKKIAKISFLPSLFNINEILLFGLPVVLNPIFLIPFLIVPLVTICTTYLAFSWGLAPLTTQAVAWNTPILLNAYIATDSLRGVALQLFNLMVATTIYLPFVILDNKIKGDKLTDSFKQLTRIAIDGTVKDSGPHLISHPDPLGGLAQNIARDLHMATQRGEIYLEFQPQVNSDTGTVYGVESLVRWNHPHLGRIPPPLFIGLSEDTGYIIPLGLWIFEESVKQLSKWQALGVRDVVMSVNISAKQLENQELPDQFIEIIQRYGVPVEDIKLEVTESIALTSHMLKNQVLARLHSMGVQLAIDDFGMGHSSLTYLKKFPVNSLKVDAILSRDVLASRSSCEIISSIAELCRALNINLVAEFVEDEEHLVRLRELGCSNIQGYFYSPPLSGHAAFECIKKTHKAYGSAALVDPFTNNKLAEGAACGFYPEGAQEEKR